MNKKKEKPKNILKEIKSYLIISLGLLIMAIGWTAFLIPSRIIGGGITGLGTTIYYMTDIPVGIIVFVVNIILVLFSIKNIGASFGIKTVFGITILSLFLGIFQKLIKTSPVNELFMAAIIGGIFIGVGFGIAFSQGGSTGGTDIIAKIINKYRNISPGKVILVSDVFIISSSYMVFHSIEKIVYGLVVMAVVAYTVDIFLEGAKQSLQVLIISKNHQEISDRIGEQVNRGITFLNGIGWYSHKETKVILIILRKYEVHCIYKIIKDIDPEAFISISKVMGVYGKGFDRIKIKS
jgi:uncharacterized membrane-anchored protein YitT (DUF2179 family)